LHFMRLLRLRQLADPRNDKKQNLDCGSPYRGTGQAAAAMTDNNTRAIIYLVYLESL